MNGEGVYVEKVNKMNAVVTNGLHTQVHAHSFLTTEKKRVGILGGTFNPPHLGHLVMAEQVGKQLGLQKVLFLPTNEPPHKKQDPSISPAHRKKMIQLAIQDNPLFEFEGVELERTGKSYTIETIQQLKERNPHDEFYFIIGGDMVATLADWHRIDELVQLVQFVAIKRLGYEETTPYPVIWVDSPEIGISSTMIRKKIKSGCTVNYLVPQPTLEYIKKEGLYR